MNRLSALLSDLSHPLLNDTSWCGPAPGENVVAHLLGKLPAQPDATGILQINAPDAVVWMSLLATTSLNHGGSVDAAVALSADIELGFSDLGVDAQFFSVGQWQVSRRMRHWEPVRADGPWKDRRYSVNFSGPYLHGLGVLGCVMGFDKASAFIFAVCEDD